MQLKLAALTVITGLLVASVLAAPLPIESLSDKPGQSKPHAGRRPRLLGHITPSKSKVTVASSDVHAHGSAPTRDDIEDYEVGVSDLSDSKGSHVYKQGIEHASPSVEISNEVEHKTGRVVSKHRRPGGHVFKEVTTPNYNEPGQPTWVWHFNPEDGKPLSDQPVEGKIHDHGPHIDRLVPKHG